MVTPLSTAKESIQNVQTPKPKQNGDDDGDDDGDDGDDDCDDDDDDDTNPTPGVQTTHGGEANLCTTVWPQLLGQFKVNHCALSSLSTFFYHDNVNDQAAYWMGETGTGSNDHDWAKIVRFLQVIHN